MGAEGRGEERIWSIHDEEVLENEAQKPPREVSICEALGCRKGEERSCVLVS